MTTLIISAEKRAIAMRDALWSDLDHWQNLVHVPNGKWRAHRTQVERITSQISGMLAGAAGKINETPTITDLGRFRRSIEILHLLWDFFRDRLVQRDSERYASYLQVADDLAWDCYKPFYQMRAAVLQTSSPDEATLLREPPLVAYSTERVPSARTRAMSFSPPGLDAADKELFKRATSALLVPLIAIPWPEFGHTPSLAFVAHEVGHIVGDDLGLCDEAANRMGALSLKSDVTVWKRWIGEILADIIATISLGQAYVAQLANALALPLAEVNAEVVETESKYPPRAVRIAIANEVLEVLKVPTYERWFDTYGHPTGVVAQYASDVSQVVSTLLQPYRELQNKELHTINNWSLTLEKEAEDLANNLLSDGVDQAAELRVWVSASCLAYEIDPKKRREKIDRKVIEKISAIRTNASRSAFESVQSGPNIKKRVEADQNYGTRLWALIEDTK